MYSRLPLAEWPGYEIDTEGVVYNRNGKKLKPDPKDNGYLRVELHKDGKRKRIVIHRLVLETFVRQRIEGEVCRHLNGNKTDNSLENLAWGTSYDNYLDSVAHGSARLSSGHRVLSPEQVVEIRSGKEGVYALARKFSVNAKTIKDCRRRKFYKDI